MRRLLRTFASAIPEGWPIPIVAGPLRGAIWYSGAAAGDGKGLSVCLNLCEPQQLHTALELSKGAICFDVGANVGLYSLLFSRVAESVYAFEPLPRNLFWLYRTMARNRATNVTIIPAAVSSDVGIVSFQEGDNCAAGKIAAGGVPVPCVSIDSIASKVGVPDVMKIDVEGAELSVLQGASTVLTHHPTILLSTHGEAVKDECLDYLSTFGYGSAPLDAAATEFLCRPASQPAAVLHSAADLH
jgi:FkbM family methyltransferase